MLALAASPPIPTPPELAAKSWYLQDFSSGRVIAAHNEDEPMPPASLTKIMTAYVVLRELKARHISLEDMVTISKKAWQTPGSRMFVEVGKQVSVEDLLKGMIIQSGNDASVSLAEHVAGSESVFAQMMNTEARRLGMDSSHFTNSTGLPDEELRVTAHDMARLTRALIQEFPDFYEWFAHRDFTYNGIKQHNRNSLLWRDATVDGVKTGHTDNAGYCLVASAKRDDMRLISVVMGTADNEARTKASKILLNYGFRFFETHKLYPAGETLTNARVWQGAETAAPLGLKTDLYVTIPRRHYDRLKAEVRLPRTILAPLGQGQQVGSVNVFLAEQAIAEQPLVTLTAIPEGSLWQKLLDKARMVFH
ncbi:MAG: D-alanyl-D-alanine carboxypeptidase [Chromatiales bacterium]|nr:D-alanyl-D-alanine carboxypeptidase [Chromatiales bacterium]